MKKSILKNRIGDEAGQTLVEFALIVALFLAIIFGIIEFGRAWFYSNHLSNSVRATARYAAVLDNISTTGGSEIVNYLTTEIDEFMPADDIASISVRYFPADGSAPQTDMTGINRGDTIEVTVTYDFNILTASVIPHLSGTRQLVRTATMQYE